MSKVNDFIIEDGVLKKYVGPGGDVVIPEGVAKIGNNVFSYSQVSGVVIPEGVAVIGMGAFAGNPLAAVTLPWDLVEIGVNAFGLCYGLTEIVIPDSVRKIGSKAFNHCGKLENVTFGDGVRAIGSDAFADTKWLKNQSGSMVFAGKVLIRAESEEKEILIPEGTVGIGGSAFGNCSNVRKIIIPESVEVIETKALARCGKLELVQIGGTPEIAKDAIPENAVVMAAKLDLDGIKSKTLKRQMALGSFFAAGNIPATVRKYVTKNFQNLIPDILRIPELPERILTWDVLEISHADLLLECAQDNTALCALLLEYKHRHFSHTEVSQQAAVREKKQLRGPTAAELKKLWKPAALPDGTMEVTGYFGNATAVTVPAMIGKKPVAKIGSCCFYVSPFDNNNRKSITLITIPEGVTAIGDRAFAGCEKLIQVHIPESLREIEEYAFWKCADAAIHAPAGSYAETYAKENNIPFVAE